MIAYHVYVCELQGLVLARDFSNLMWFQKGMKSRGFRCLRPNPDQERKITNFQCILAKYMSTAAPSLLR
jgi:hypothetical protein